MSNLAIIGAISASVIIAVIWAGVLHQRAKREFRAMQSMRREGMEG